jgi:hypothetical protein
MGDSAQQAYPILIIRKGVLYMFYPLYAVRYFLPRYTLYAARCTLFQIRSTKDYVRKNKLFMQNKANFQKVKLNVNKVLTKDYDKMDTWSIGKNKPNSNPIQTQFKANTNPIKANTNPIKAKTNPNKPNFQAQNIDGPVQISKISENVCFTHKGLCF